MKANNNYAVFILTHGRPDNVITYETLRNIGYTGKIYLICDDTDNKLDQYKSKYGDEVIVFSKDDYQGKFDMMDNFSGNKVIVYARNACYDIARSLGLDYFFEYEDDYTSFLLRYEDGDKLRGAKISDMNLVFKKMITCLENTGSHTIAFAQGGDFIGGAANFSKNKFKRKAMNSFLFKVNKNKKDDLIFIGRMNDDVNTYLSLGSIGKIFVQISTISLTQMATQKNAGGNTETYKDYGTYVKSFYSVMIAPSCVKISLMGTTNRRIHHSIRWRNAVPKIIEEAWKK